jgi:hypothetical protein
MEEGQSAAAGASGTLGGVTASGRSSAQGGNTDADTATSTTSSDADIPTSSASSTISNPISDIEPDADTLLVEEVPEPELEASNDNEVPDPLPATGTE